MYSVLIVDDEVTICKGLSVLIDWEKYGFEVSDYAYNGLEALEKAKSFRYDLIVTDIRMPEVDGIELIRSLKEMKYTARIIILSGYKDFEYARAAVEYGVKNYVLKPVDEEVLISLIKDIKVEIEEELQRNITIMESKSIIRERALEELVKNGTGSFPVFSKAVEAGVDLNTAYYRVCLVETDDNSEEEAGNGVFFSKKIIEEIVCKHSIGYVFELEEEKTGILLCLSEQNFNDAEKIIIEIFDCISRCVCSGITIAVGNKVCGYKDIPLSYRNAVKALEWKFFSGRNRIIYFDAISVLNEPDGITFNWNFEELQRNVKSGNREAILADVEQLFQEVIVNRLPISVVFGIVINNFIRIIGLINDIGGNIQDMLGEKYSFEAIQKMQTIHELKGFFVNVCFKVSDYIKNAESSRSNKTIDAIVMYINEFYYKEMSLITLSKKYFMSPVYLGRLFKNATGMGFTDYVNKYRVDIAARLLESDELMVCEISEQVGYKDINYFYKLFKRVKGITPSEYRMVYSKK